MIILVALLETFGFEIGSFVAQLVVLLIIAKFIFTIRRNGFTSALFNSLALLTGIACLLYGVSRLNDADSSNDIAGAILTVAPLILWAVLGNVARSRSRKEH